MLKHLLVTPLLIIAGGLYGLWVGLLLGVGMAMLIRDASFDLHPLGRMLWTTPAIFLGVLAILGWTIAGLTAGLLLPVLDRGAFSGMMNYVRPRLLLPFSSIG